MELVVLEPGKVMQETAGPVFCVLGIGNGNVRVKMVGAADEREGRGRVEGIPSWLSGSVAITTDVGS